MPVGDNVLKWRSEQKSLSVALLRFCSAEDRTQGPIVLGKRSTPELPTTPRLSCAFQDGGGIVWAECMFSRVQAPVYTQMEEANFIR